jgi:hypothetical protein
MATFDQAQTFRLGQVAGQDNTQVLIVDASTIPEAPWHGMLIYRSDLQVLQIYRSSLQGGDDAFEDVVGGAFGLLTFVGDEIPTSINQGDLWYDTANNRVVYRAASAGANEVRAGEWELMTGPVNTDDMLRDGMYLRGPLVVSDQYTFSPQGDAANSHGGLRMKGNTWLIQIPADESDVLFYGQSMRVRMEKFATRGNSELHGLNRATGSLLLSGPYVRDPSGFPEVTTYYPSAQMPISDTYGLGYAQGAGNYCTLDQAHNQVVRIEQDTIDSTCPAPPGALMATGNLDNIFVLAYDGGALKIHKYSGWDLTGSAVPPPELIDLGATTDPCRSTLGYWGMGSLISVVEHRDETTGWSGDAVVTVWDTTEEPWVVMYTFTVPSLEGDMAGVTRETINGNTRIVIAPTEADAQVFSIAGVRQPAEEWPRPWGKPMRGVLENTVLDPAGVRRTLAAHDDETYRFGVAGVDADPPTKSTGIAWINNDFIRVNRSSIWIDFPLLDNPTAAPYAQVVAHKMDGIDPYHPQVVVHSSLGGVGLSTVDTVTAYPSYGAWGSAAPMVVEAEQGGFWIDGDSDGDPGTGSFADAIQAIADAAASAAAAALVDSSPAALDTLNELAAAIGDDANFATTVTNALATKATTADLNTEITNRTNADTALQALIDAEAALARNADNLTSGTVADARIASTIARDSEVTAAVAAEAALARDATNLTSGTVPEARLTVANTVTMGIGRAATQAETNAGTDTQFWVTPQKMAIRLAAAYQPLDSTLSGMAAVSMSVADRFMYTTGADTFTSGTITSFARNLLNDADADEARTTLAAMPLRYTSLNVTAAGATAFDATWEQNQVYWNNAAAQTLELPLNATLAIVNNARFRFMRLGAGTFTITPAAGVTLNGKTSTSALASATVTRYGQVELWKRAADFWVIVGDFT